MRLFSLWRMALSVERVLEWLIRKHLAQYGCSIEVLVPKRCGESCSGCAASAWPDTSISLDLLLDLLPAMVSSPSPPFSNHLTSHSFHRLAILFPTPSDLLSRYAKPTQLKQSPQPLTRGSNKASGKGSSVTLKMSSNAGDIMRYLQGEDMPGSNSVTGRWPPGYVSLARGARIFPIHLSNDEDSQILDFVNYEALELPAESEYQSTSDESVEATPEPTAASPVRKGPIL